MQKAKLLTKEEYMLKVEKELARLNNNREAWHQIAALLQPPKKEKKNHTPTS